MSDTEPELIEIFDCEQQSDEWYALRCGIPTASNFSSILASSPEAKMRTKLMRLMAGEILSGVPMETFCNASMSRGRQMEAAALEHYAFTRAVELRRVGFVRRTISDPLGSDLIVGCSPDSLVGDHGLVQVKTMQPDLIVALVDGHRRFPTEHIAQCQGELWVTGRKWIDLMIFYTGMPIAPTFRLERDERYIDNLKREVEKFCHELRQLVARVKQKGNIR